MFRSDYDRKRCPHCGAVWGLQHERDWFELCVAGVLRCLRLLPAYDAQYGRDAGDRNAAGAVSYAMDAAHSARLLGLVETLDVHA